MRLSLKRLIPAYHGLPLLLMLALTGCAATPPAEPGDSAGELALDIPDQWSEDPENDPDTGAQIGVQWWQAFGDEQLDALVEKAYRHNPDLAATAQSVIQADLALQNAGAGLLPSLTAGASTGRQAQQNPGSDRVITGATSGASLSLDYELDLWGRLAATEASALAGLQANRFDLQTARLTLASSVVTSWLRLLETRGRLDIAERNLATAERTLELVEARYRNGVADRSELVRQQTNVLVRRNALPPLAYQLRQNTAALNLLTGDFPYDSSRALTTDKRLEVLTVPAINPGSPADVITARPDLAAAEARLRAANADIEQARAALLPRLSLGAAVRLAAGGFLSLADPARSATGLLSLSQTLFDGGQRHNAVALSRSQRVALLEGYRSNLLSAFQETGDALDRVALSAEQELRLETIQERAEETLRLTEIRYREGSEDLLDLLETQRGVFDTRGQLTQARLERLLAAVDLYRALGGGLL